MSDIYKETVNNSFIYIGICIVENHCFYPRSECFDFQTIMDAEKHKGYF